MPRALLVVDLEATCWERRDHRPEEMETIEIGAVLVEPGHLPREFQSFARPARNPTLSDFCRALTTITQAEVDAAEPFPAAFARFLAWIGDPARVLFASWGEYDQRQFLRDCVRHRVSYPFDGHWNVKRAAARALGRKPAGMAETLAVLGLGLEGTHHRGLDDARNVLRIVEAALAAEREQALAGPPPPAPGDRAQRLARFLGLVLRHRARDFGLEPDAEGFVHLSELEAVVVRHAVPRASAAEVRALLEAPRQQRFELRGEHVRARPAGGDVEPAG
jgi:3'-5' exoribonuclease 1